MRDSSNSQHNMHAGNTGHGCRWDDTANRAGVSNHHGYDAAATLGALSTCFNATGRAADCGAAAALSAAENQPASSATRDGGGHAHAHRPRWLFRVKQAPRDAHSGRSDHHRDV